MVVVFKKTRREERSTKRKEEQGPWRTLSSNPSRCFDHKGASLELNVTRRIVTPIPGVVGPKSDVKRGFRLSLLA